MEHVSGAIGIDDVLCGNAKRRRGDGLAEFVVPDEPVFAHGDAADLHSFVPEELKGCAGMKMEMLAEAFGHDGDVDEGQELERVGAHAAAIERCEHTPFAA